MILYLKLNAQFALKPALWTLFWKKCFKFYNGGLLQNTSTVPLISCFTFNKSLKIGKIKEKISHDYYFSYFVSTWFTTIKSLIKVFLFVIKLLLSWIRSRFIFSISACLSGDRVSGSVEFSRALNALLINFNPVLIKP